MYISTQNELEDFVARAKTSEVLAIDTEFLRENTYFPQLCLIQLATEDGHVIVDPFTIESLEVLRCLLEDTSITKLFHAGSQDLEILYHELGVIPAPLFDTQIAAALLGLSAQIGYGSLVSHMCGVSLKKGDSFTDWSRRPLTKSQIAYAADDVMYLPKMFRIMRSRLLELGRLHWLDADFEELARKTRAETLPEERYKKLKRVNQLNRRQLAAARELAAWRENLAVERNIPRKRVLADEQVVEACKREPAHLDAFFLVRGISERLTTSEARSALEAIQRGLNSPKETWPVLTKPSSNEIHVDVEVDALAAIARLRAKENSIAFQALVSMSDLVEVARGYTQSEVLKGWRYELVGKDLQAFMAGEIELHIEDGTLKVTNRK